MLKVVIAALLASTSGVAASNWVTLRDDVFGYELPIPTEYRLTLQPKTGASRIYHNPDGDLVVVWGADLDERDLGAEMEDRRQQDAAAGWNITYTRLTANWASYSGVIGDQIRYVRGIRYCGDRAAFFIIDYARDDKAAYDPIITHMVRNLRQTAGC